MAGHLLLLSGSTRPGATSTAVLRTVLELVPPGAGATLYDGLAELPAFLPGADAPPRVRELQAVLARADAVLVCTPEYAGSLPGSLKNLLDRTVGDGDLHRERVGWLDVAAPGRRAGVTAALVG